MTASIIGLLHESSCDCCGKEHIDTVVVQTTTGVVKWGCVCAARLLRNRRGEPMKPASIKKDGAFMKGVYECGNQDFLRRPVTLAA